MLVTPLFAATLPSFLVPIWLLSVGITLAAIALLLVWAGVALVSRSAAASIPRIISESILQYVVYLGGALVVFNLVVLGWSLALGDLVPYRELAESAQRIPQVGTETVSATVEPGEEDVTVDVSFRAAELIEYTITSDQDLWLATEPGKALDEPLISVEGAEAYGWKPGARRSIAFDGQVDTIYLSNTSGTPAQFTMQYTTEVTMPQVYGVGTTATATILLFLVYLGIAFWAPRSSVVALATAKEAISQPLYWMLMVGGAVALVIFLYVPYNTFGEDVKMLKSTGLTLIMILSVIFALWTASTSISEEIEGRTALTVLSKPVSRRQFLLGKFLGIIWPILLMFVLLGFVLLVTVSYKVVYDARETSNPPPNWQLCYDVMIGTVPGLVLAFLEAVVLAAISVAISTRLPMLPNLIIGASIYVLGHLGPLIAQSSAGEIVFVSFIGQLIAIVLPVLDHFNMEAAIAGGEAIPFTYLGLATLYAALYCTIAMLFGLLLLEDRDLA